GRRRRGSSRFPLTSMGRRVELRSRARRPGTRDGAREAGSAPIASWNRDSVAAISIDGQRSGEVSGGMADALTRRRFLHGAASGAALLSVAPAYAARGKLAAFGSGQVREAIPGVT